MNRQTASLVFSSQKTNEFAEDRPKRLFPMSLRTLVHLFAIVCLLGGASCSPAQTIPEKESAPASAVSNQTVLVLNGLWKFRTGDDPAWAKPDYDDSGWQDYRIVPNRSELSVAEAVQSDPLPGWQSHGHPGYAGYAWYRLRVQAPAVGGSLALLMPQYVDDAYEVYVDGQKIGAFGELDGYHFFYFSRPLVFPIPAGVLSSDRPLTLAIRFWSKSSEGLSSRQGKRGGFRGVPLLGAPALLDIYRRTQLSQMLDDKWQLLDLLSSFLYGAVGVISLFLFALMRSRREYLWAGISMLGIFVMDTCFSIGAYVRIPAQFILVCQHLAEWVGLSAGVVFGMYLLNVDKPHWRRLIAVSSAAIFSGVAISTGLYLGLLPATPGWDKGLNVLPIALFGTALLVLAMAIDGIRTNRLKALAPLSPGVLGACGLLLEQAGERFAMLSFLLETAVPVALLFVFLWRFVQQQRENEQYSMDVKQAQEVQQLLLAERLPQVPGFVMDSAYLPAREVGGDFFQVLIPTSNGKAGSLLIVFGDVAGKGLPAAMLVAMLVGAIRTRAEETHAPSSILAALNDRLCATTGGAFATCLALSISAEGAVHLANAGHPHPYKSGREVELPGSLPLGVVAGVAFETHTFQLQPGDRLTLASDGVFEAKNGKHELFGFERLQAISAEPADRIASAARRFGQEDDITVLTIQRTLALSSYEGSLR
jgi:hypothetical protein